MSTPFDSVDATLYDVPARAPGPIGALPLTPQLLRDWPSGQGGSRAADGTPSRGRSHGTLGSRVTGGRGLARVLRARRNPFRGSVHRSLRWAIAGNRRQTCDRLR